MVAIRCCGQRQDKMGQTSGRYIQLPCPGRWTWKHRTQTSAGIFRESRALANAGLRCGCDYGWYLYLTQLYYFFVLVGGNCAN